MRWAVKRQYVYAWKKKIIATHRRNWVSGFRTEGEGSLLHNERRLYLQYWESKSNGSKQVCLGNSLSALSLDFIYIEFLNKLYV